MEVNTVFQVINDPSDVDEFIKKAIKEMERVGKESKKKKKDLDHEGKYEEEDLEEQDEYGRFFCNMGFVLVSLTHSHTMTPFDTPRKQVF